jgi:wyosine [tRNA(Phe)-imidazoG37] synthetase (radical SAM superfamily)
MTKLTVTNHTQNIDGFTYIYPVISRRVGGLSIGVNFNINNTCNWRCIYCQVPQLKLGAAPALDTHLLQQELNDFLVDVLEGDFYERMEIPSHQRMIKDIAIAGNGEPTTLKTLDIAVKMIGDIAVKREVFPNSRFILITNGSLIHRTQVKKALMLLNTFNGEVWFKLDSGTIEGRLQLNHFKQSNETILRNLQISSQHCLTKIQICLVDYQNQGLSMKERIGLINLLSVIKEQTTINEVTVYTLARPSMQPEAIDLKCLSSELMQSFATQVTELGYRIDVIT